MCAYVFHWSSAFWKSVLYYSEFCKQQNREQRLCFKCRSHLQTRQFGMRDEFYKSNRRRCNDNSTTNHCNIMQTCCNVSSMWTSKPHNAATVLLCVCRGVSLCSLRMWADIARVCVCVCVWISILLTVPTWWKDRPTLKPHAVTHTHTHMSHLNCMSVRVFQSLVFLKPPANSFRKQWRHMNHLIATWWFVFMVITKKAETCLYQNPGKTLNCALQNK